MRNKDKTYEPADLTGVKRYPHAERASKAVVDSFGCPLEHLNGADFFDCLPQYLKANDLRNFIKAVGIARRAGKPFHVMMGAHVIKVGLSPIVIDLLRRGIITSLSFNSAGLIHDLEVAFFGATSEDVLAGLADGSFGMVRDTAQLFARVCDIAEELRIGLGAAAGMLIREREAPYMGYSLFASASELDIPATIHAGIGTDIVAQHPEFDGAKVGAGSHRDFRILCSICAEIDRGGVIANLGSAVILPEVFLKALTVARNLNPGESQLTSANFDMIAHYRPMMNVVSRTTHDAGKGYNFVGHHELMVPLLAWGLRREMEK